MGLHHGQANFVTYGKPSLFLDFANKKSLVDRISGNNLITFERASIGTYVDENGLIKTAAADEARFDHNPETGESLGLLIEEQRTNLFTYSEDFSDISWTKAEASISNVSVINPSGGSTSTKITESANGPSQHGIYYDRSGNAGTYTLSVFLKAAERTIAFLQLSNFQTAAANINVNLTDGSVYIYGTNADYTYINAYTIPYGNGWYRCILTATKATTTTYNIPLIATHNGTIATYTGDGVSGIYVWGAQLEQGFFPTSYIPTSGSTLTRQPDSAIITGTNFTDFYNQNEGSFIATFKFESLGVFSYNDAIGLSPLGAAFMADNGSFGLVTDIWGGGTRSSGGPDPSSQFVKVARAVNFSNNDSVILSSGGNAVAQSSITQTLATGIQFGKRGNGGVYNNRNLKIKQLIYYPTRLTNTQLQGLTE